MFVFLQIAETFSFYNFIRSAPKIGMKLLILFSSPVLMMVFCLSKEYSWVFIFRFEIRIRPPLKCLQTFSWDYHLAAARIFSQHMKSSLTNIAWKSQHQQNLWTPSTNGSQGIWFGSMQFYQSVSCVLRSLTLVTVMGILFLFWVQNSEHHLGVKTQPKLVLGDTTW